MLICKMRLPYTLVALLSLALSSASPTTLNTSKLIPENKNSMVTAVVGAGGATGLECVKKLLSEGHTVKAVSDRSVHLRSTGCMLARATALCLACMLT